MNKVMNKVIVKNLVLLSIFIFSVNAQKKETIYIERPELSEIVKKAEAKSEFKDYYQQIYESLNSSLTSFFSEIKQFSVVERRSLETLRKEVDISNSGNVSSDSTIKDFNIKGAKFVVLPSISLIEISKESKLYKISETRDETYKFNLSVTVKIIDNSTTEISNNIFKTVNRTFVYDNLEKEQKVNINKDILDVINSISKDVADGFIAKNIKATILSVVGNRLMINQGTNSGFTVGKKIEIYAVSEVKDIDSDEVFIDEIPVGKANIIQADHSKCFANITGENLGIARGCIVRIIKD